jgi:hypothetical protein
MSGYSIYNRHANMDAETLTEVGNLISDVRFGPNGNDGVNMNTQTGFDLINELYGLYDGYLYDSLLINAENANLPKELFRRIIKVWVKVSKYPMIQYFAGSDEPVEQEPAEYSPNMGIAEAKAYLASIS